MIIASFIIGSAFFIGFAIAFIFDHIKKQKEKEIKAIVTGVFQDLKKPVPDLIERPEGISDYYFQSEFII